MCKYCSDFFDPSKIWDMQVDITKNSAGLMTLTLEADSRTNGLTVVASYDSGYQWSSISSTPFNYCPFCGKRLTPYKSRNITNLSPEEQKEVFEEYCRMKYGQIENTEFNEGADIDLTEENIKKGEHPLLGKFPEWVPDLLKDVGKKVRNDQGEFIGIFEGITASFEDYYYRIRREDGSIVYESCVGNINFV